MSKVDSRARRFRTILRMRPTEIGALMKWLMRVKRVNVKVADTLTMWLDPASDLGYKLIFLGEYETSLVDVMQHVLRPKDVFLDLGANEGYFSLVASRLCADGSVVAVEPQTRLAPVLLRNLELNGSRNIRIRACAVGDQIGETTLHLRPSTYAGASGQFRRNLDVRKETVPLTTVDRLFSEENLARIRIMKIDCEGAELSIINGAKDVLLARRIDFIALEFHPTIGSEGSARTLKTHNLLTEMGYRLTKLAAVDRVTEAARGSHGRHIYHLPELRAQLEGLKIVERDGSPWVG